MLATYDMNKAIYMMEVIEFITCFGVKDRGIQNKKKLEVDLKWYVH